MVLALTVAGFGAFAVYQHLVLDLNPLGEMPPLFGPFHLAQSLFGLAASTAIVWTIYSERAVAHGFDRASLSSVERAAAAAAMGSALGSTALFLIDPQLFGLTAQEDRSVEWLSALLLFGASAVFLRSAIKRGDTLVRLAALALAMLFFVMAMEEISWMQRLFGYTTPDQVAAVNWQGEFNFHNVNTDLFENFFYVGSCLFLILLPFIADATPWRAGLGALSSFVPGRWVAAASAPTAIFNYGMWNVLPQQMTMMITALVLGFYARAASRRGETGESRLFAGLTLAVIAGQAVFLAWGGHQSNIWEASEYKELFIAIGFAAYALGVGRSISSEPARGPSQAG